MTCLTCGEPMAPRPGWAACLRCRRAGRTAPPSGFQPEVRVCAKPTCAARFEARRATQVYCRPEHRRSHPDGKQVSTVDAGYGAEHRRLREWWVSEIGRRGSVSCRSIACLLPGVPIGPGDAWDLGHTVDRSAWTGPEHPRCNRAEGARRRNRKGRTAGIRLVVGPPCAGKTTYVQRHAEAGDLIVDLDQIAVDLGSPSTHNHPEPIRLAAEARVQQLVREIRGGQHRSAWVIRTIPSEAKRRAFAHMLKASEVIVVTEPRATLLERASRRPDPEQTVRAIDHWFASGGR